MTQPTYVLIHGGQHTRECWSPTATAMHALQPEARVLAVNLPGHGDEPGDLGKLTIAQCADSVVAKVRAMGCARVVLVGHSMAGITLPAVAERLGAEVVQKMIFVACCVPPDGGTVFDTLQQPMKFIAGLFARKRTVSPPMPPAIAAFMFGNGMDAEQKATIANCLCAESAIVGHERVDRSRLPAIPKSWVLTLRDRALRPALQRKFIANLGGVEEVIELDTCHDAMISEPHQLARIILGAA